MKLAHLNIGDDVNIAAILQHILPICMKEHHYTHIFDTGIYLEQYEEKNGSKAFVDPCI